jgi:tetratricopeptide (TPR) repeat protein
MSLKSYRYESRGSRARLPRRLAVGAMLALVSLVLAATPPWPPAPLAQTDTGEQEGASCDLLVQRAMESLISDRYREALSYVEQAFGLAEPTTPCQAHCLQTRSCAYLRMGEREQAVQALAQLFDINPNPPYDGRMFPPAMNRLFRAVRDSFMQAGTMDIGTVAVLDFKVLNPSKFRYEDYDYDALGKALQMIIATDIIESTNLAVVDRTNMKDVLAELQLSANADLANQENRVRLGQLLNAHAFITGQIALFDKDHVRIDIQVIHAATSRVLARHYEGPFSGNTVDLLKLQRGVLAAVTEALNEFRTEVKRTDLLAPDPIYFDHLQQTHRDGKKYMESWLLQGQAIDLEDKGDVKGAIKAWEKVAKLDPEDKVARGRIWALKSELEH